MLYLQKVNMHENYFTVLVRETLALFVETAAESVQRRPAKYHS